MSLNKKAKIILGVGGVVVLAGGIYFIMKKRKQAQLQNNTPSPKESASISNALNMDVAAGTTEVLHVPHSSIHRI